MLKKIVAGCALVLAFGLNQAQATDVKVTFPVSEAMQMEKVKALFDGDIQFYWGDQPHPPVVKDFGNFKTSKRTNGFAKTRENACGWAMASALVALRDRARKEGAMPLSISSPTSKILKNPVRPSIRVLPDP